MIALSIQQPWAWLIIKGEKLIENRYWPTRYSGHLAIHASKKFDEDGYRWVKENFPSLKMPKPTEFVTGAIIGIVHMTGCIDYSSTPDPRSISPWFFGPYGFVFRDPVELERPIPYRGMPGFFEVNING
ncbi:MAG: ASCH domain protein [Syntrophorhabdus sp. PtaU1.Bin058]|nr:MAG: ASCH domain protein [Syntrophorhabdus sp. PtaU1.Bin058]